MAKLLIILFIVVVGTNLLAALAQRQDVAGGQIGNDFFHGKIPGGALVDDLLSDVTGGANDLLCTLVGPDFLRVVLTQNRCPSGIFLPTLFKSYKSYCEFFNRQPAITKQCLSDAATRVNVGLDGLVKLDLLLGICCKNCNTKSNFGRGQPLGGQIGHDFIRLGISSAGLVGGLVSGLFDTSNHLVCSLLGPNFLPLLLSECENCANGDRSSTALKSYEDFCSFFNRLSADGKKCYTDGAIRIKGPSVFRIDLVLGKCCAQCAGLPQSPPSTRTNK